MDAGGVEKYGRAGGAEEFFALLERQLGDIGTAEMAWGVPAMAPFDVLEGAGLDVAQVEGELHLARDAVGDLGLVVPHVAVPAVKVALGGEGLPALGLAQRIARAK